MDELTPEERNEFEAYMRKWGGSREIEREVAAWGIAHERRRSAEERERLVEAVKDLLQWLTATHGDMPDDFSPKSALGKSIRKAQALLHPAPAEEMREFGTRVAANALIEEEDCTLHIDGVDALAAYYANAIPLPSADACVCGEASARNCPVHQSADAPEGGAAS